MYSVQLDQRHFNDLDGEVLQFEYMNGTNPGSVRLVYVLGYKGKNLSAYDMVNECFRTFCPSACQNPMRLTDVKRVDMSELPKDISAKYIAEGFQAEGLFTFNDKDSGLVIAAKMVNVCPHCGGTL